MDELTEAEIEIAKIQSAIKKFGYQWQESQFNDGFDEVYIQLTIDTDSSAIRMGNSEVGWGRMDRLVAWEKALDWATKRSGNQ